MIYYLNMGFIIEQALVDIVKKYLDQQQLDKVYNNFHISVTNEHPFAHMIVDDHARASDNFPSIVISSQRDQKPSDLANMPAQAQGIFLTAKDIDFIINSTQRNKMKINSNGEKELVKKNGEIVKEKIPGFVFVYDEKTISKLKEIANSRTIGEKDGGICGIKIDTRRRDNISIEIWAENNQLKNELYEHLRLFIASSVEEILYKTYEFFHPSIFENSVIGERGQNYNFDFDCVLYGSHISFDVDYDVSQIILDTDIKEINYEIIGEVINHVKEN